MMGSPLETAYDNVIGWDEGSNRQETDIDLDIRVWSRVLPQEIFWKKTTFHQHRDNGSYTDVLERYLSLMGDN